MGSRSRDLVRGVNTNFVHSLELGNVIPRRAEGAYGQLERIAEGHQRSARS